MVGLDLMTLAALVLVAVLLLGLAWGLRRRRESRRLEGRFGTEYRRAVQAHGSRGAAESDLRARERRVADFRLVPLSPADAERFAACWNEVQRRFVDDPADSVADADRLVNQLMQARGYPMSDFDRLAADLSVDHAEVVEHYRTAHEIVQRHGRGEADTEALRKAVVHFRALFHDLLEADEARVALPALPAQPQEAR